MRKLYINCMDQDFLDNVRNIFMYVNFIFGDFVII